MKVYGNPTYTRSSHDKLTNGTILGDKPTYGINLRGKGCLLVEF